MDNEKFQELVLQQFNKVFEKLDTLEKVQSKMESRMESEVVDKIRGLFDDREVKNARFDRLEETLDDISTDTRYLVARVAKLGKLAK